MLDAIFFNGACGVGPRVKSSSENLLELPIEASDSQLLKVEVLLEYLFLFNSVCFNRELGLFLGIDGALELSGLFGDDSVPEMPEVYIDVLYLKDSALQDEAFFIELKGEDLTLVDQLAAEEGVDSFKKGGLLNLNGPFDVFGQLITCVEYVQLDLNGLQRVHVLDSGGTHLHLFIFTNEHGFALKLAQTYCAHGNGLQLLCSYNKLVNFHKDLVATTRERGKVNRVEEGAVHVSI